ncbi:hypothetical protein [Nostoc sp. ChiVER01]|uniref:WD40 repeat domain-containing protein n=1 Tax=Nostoc sp. ChiVER01 TaxID=3075382 RepID=UPI002AD3AB1B|nr:hypothetical protein [Nostoc sp. ChiVER01]MDZ8226427.1 hypothetical protein [Nostoc sp. ChiVER01]
MTFNQQPPNKIERLRREHNTLNKLWNLYHQKWTKLGEDLAIENDTATKNKLEKQIKDAKTELNDIEIQLSNIESMLPQRQITQSRDDAILQESSNREIPEIDQEIEQVKEELRKVRKRPRISNLWSYLKDLRIKVCTRKNRLIILFVLVLCSGGAVFLPYILINFNPDVCQLPAADVSNIDFSPDGKYLATASLDKTVRILKVSETITDQKTKLVVACQEHTESVVAVKFSPDREYLATATLDSAYLWKVNDNHGIITLSKIQDLSHVDTPPNNKLQYRNPVVAIDFSSQDGKYLATASADGKIKVWITKTTEAKVLPTPPGQAKAYIVSVSFSHDGNYIATTDVNEIANVWELKADDGTLTPRSLLSIPNVTDVAFNLKNKENNIYFATARADGTVQVRDISNLNQPIPSLNHNTYVVDVSFSPGGKFIAAIGLDKKVSVWDRETKNSAIPLLTQESLKKNTNVAAIAFSLDDEYLAVAHTDGKVSVWNTINRTEEDSLTPQVKGLVTLAFSSTTNGEYLLAMAGVDGQIEMKKFKRK